MFQLGKAKKKNIEHSFYYNVFMLQNKLLLSDYLLYYNIGIFFITSERGFCSNYNTLIVESFVLLIEQLKLYKQDNFRIFGIGTKGIKLIFKHKKKNNYLKNVSLLIRNIELEKKNSFQFASFIIKNILYGNNAKIDQLIFLYYSSNHVHTPEITICLIPIRNFFNKIAQISFEQYFNFIVLYTIKMFSIVYQNTLFVEENARLTAMDDAVKNIEEIIKKCTIMYNSSRQASITTALLEIIVN
jgi:F-type H+-transporting ATPase subunit gamma